ncbi:MAG TPA: hypothetical protein VD866_27660, partial [Urbifossiella sp.]|nr:hypothetical protein [Urbifossiella sp.]
DRPYRAALPTDVCLSILRKDAVGGGLDPELVEEFCALPFHELKRIGGGAVARLQERTPGTMRMTAAAPV